MEFKEFKVEDLWAVDDWVYGKDKKWRTQFDRPIEGSLPVISGQTTNNGVKYYTSDNYSANEVFEDCLTMTTRGESGRVFYHPGKFLLANNVLVMKMPKYSKNVMLYLGTVIEKVCRSTNYSVYPTKDSLKTKTIFLPVTPSGEIDFDYMEQYIEKIEKQYIEKIEKQYTEKITLMLKASGLDNYQLTEEEKAVLKEEKEKKEFKIEELFETIPTNRLHYKAGDYKVKTKIADLPATTCSNSNQMLTCYVPRKGATILKNCISVTANGDATCFYQPNEFTILQDSYAIKAKNECSENVYLYFVAVLQKVLKVKYSWTNKSGWNKLKNDTIWLPINPEGEIDFDYMEKYISAIIKTKIKNVVLEINKKLELYKQTQN